MDLKSVSEEVISTFAEKLKDCSDYEILELMGRNPKRDNYMLHGGNWIPTNVSLPPMFETVFVRGDTKEYPFHLYCARRWTGWSSGWPGISEGKEPPWDWIASPSDFPITNVTHWFPMPRGERKYENKVSTSFG